MLPVELGNTKISTSYTKKISWDTGNNAQGWKRSDQVLSVLAGLALCVCIWWSFPFVLSTKVWWHDQQCGRERGHSMSMLLTTTRDTRFTQCTWLSWQLWKWTNCESQRYHCKFYNGSWVAIVIGSQSEDRYALNAIAKSLPIVVDYWTWNTIFTSSPFPVQSPGNTCPLDSCPWLQYTLAIYHSVIDVHFKKSDHIRVHIP